MTTPLIKTAQQLRDALLPLDRTQAAALLTQAAHQADADVAALQADLVAAAPAGDQDPDQSWHERHRLCLLIARIRDDTQGIIELGLASPAPGIALLAASSTSLVDHAEFDSLLDAASVETRSRLLRTVLRACKDPSRVDAVYQRVALRFGADVAAVLLPACSAATVKAVLTQSPPLSRCMPLRVARRHPLVLLDMLRIDLASSPSADGVWRRYSRSISAALVASALPPKQHVQFVQDLVHLLSQHPGVRSLDPVRDLIVAGIRHGGDAATEQIVAWCTASAGASLLSRVVPLLTSRSRLFRRLSHEHRTTLARAMLAKSRRLVSVSPMVAMLRPGSRNQFVHQLLQWADTELGGDGNDDARLLGSVNSLLQVLPRISSVHSDLAQRLADRAAATRDMTVHPARALPLAQWASSAVAGPLLDRMTRSKEASERSQALSVHLLRSVSHPQGDLLAAMSLVTQRLLNEQDPVRREVLGQLQRLPMCLLSAELVPLLEQLHATLVSSRDSSPELLHAFVFRLLSRASPSSPLFRWAHSLVLGSEEQLGAMRYALRPRQMPVGNLHAVMLALLDNTQASKSADVRLARHDVLLYLVSQLPDRCLASLPRRVHDLIDNLSDISKISFSSVNGTHTAAIALALRRVLHTNEYAPLVLRLVKADPSVVHSSHAVWMHLVFRQPSALLPLFRPGHPKGVSGLLDKVTLQAPCLAPGRWNRSSHTFLPRVPSNALAAWPTRVRTGFLACARVFAALVGPKSWQGRAVRTSVILPLAPQAELLDAVVRATPSEPGKPIKDAEAVHAAEAALHALSHIERPAAALPVLLTERWLASNEARVAVYSVRRILLRVPSQVARNALSAAMQQHDTLLRRITVHKEILRLLGTLAFPGADELLAAHTRANVKHRDVKIAAAAAAVQLLPSDKAWDLLAYLADTAEEEDVVRATMFAQLPRAAKTQAIALKAVQHHVRIADHPKRAVQGHAVQMLLKWYHGSEDVVAGKALEMLLAGVSPSQDEIDAKEGRLRTWSLALDLLRSMVCSSEPKHAADALCAAAATLSKQAGEQVATARMNATRLCDLPALRRLDALAIRLWNLDVDMQRRLAGTISKIADSIVAAAPSPVALSRLRLYLAVVDWSDATAASARVAELVAAPALPSSCVPGLVEQAISRWASDAIPSQELALAAAMAGSKCVAMRVAAVAVTARACRTDSWTDDALALLRTLRSDADAEVSYAAFQVETYSSE